MTSPPHSAFRQFCAAFVAAALVLQPLGVYAASITPSLANIPLQAQYPIKPNIMFTMDDSGSMGLATLPDYVNGTLTPAYTGVPPVFFVNYFPPDDRYSYAWCLGRAGDSVLCALTSPPLASSDLNHLYYDPAITFFPGKRADGTNLRCEATDTAGNECTGPLTAVYTDGFAGYPNANTSPTTNLVNGYPDEVFCTTATPTADQLATGVSGGTFCRYNGVTYSGTGGYRYPSSTYPYRVPVTGNPYYYTITSVQFCATRNANGWGTGSCTPQWSSTNRYVSYGAGGFDPAAFVRVDISPSDTAQMRNFAKWYAFARTRILAMKSAGGLGFSAKALLDKTRVGFNTLNSFTNNFLNTVDFTNSNRDIWFQKFYSVKSSGVTPSIDAMWQIGEYFSNNLNAQRTVTFTASAGVPSTTVTAALPGATDPQAGDTGKCRPNYHLLATDGYFNQSSIPARSGVAGPIGNADLTVPASLPGPISGFTPNQPFPLPYREGSGANTTSNTMADIAMYYWINDLRPDVPDKGKDSVAPWQHVVFYGLALGAEGTLPYRPETITDITAGTIPWPKPVNYTATAIDDLWHAAVNGRGRYVNVQSADELARGIVGILADLLVEPTTTTAVGLTTGGTQLTAKSFGYRTSYDNGWWGDLRKYALDPSTGLLLVDPITGKPQPLWEASPQLDAQVAGTGWDKNRRIVTINDATGVAVAFRYANLSLSQRDSLTAGWLTISPVPVPAGDTVVNYLRGDRSNEGVGLSNFRVRSHVLGDIVGSGAVPVGAPRQPYSDPGYKDFASAKSSRTPMVYVGANDGMLHAFIDANTADAGKEAWAFVPKALFSSGDPNDTAHTPSHEFQIGALSYPPLGLEKATFDHKFYVDATPRVWDVDFKNTDTATPPPTGNDWRTILVGGLGAGGRAIYALDVTTPVALTDTEATVAGKVLWEFTETNLGYVFDAPTLVKTKRYGWVALVVSGYNNPGGKGFLYVLNPKTGKLVHPTFGKIPLPPDLDLGTEDRPTGLSTVRAFTSSRRDPYVLQAYSGDLKGNVWRFDLSDPDESKWKAELIAKLTDANGNPQPITTGIRVEVDQNNNVDRYLFVGTGKLLGVPDLTDESVRNSLYVIKDGTRTAAGPAPATPYSRADLKAVDGATKEGFAGTATGRGWYLDALNIREKVVTDVTADVQTVVAVFTTPSDDDLCETAFTSRLYARDYTTGSSVIQSEGGAVVPSIDNVGAIAGVSLIQSAAAAGGLSGDVRVQVTTLKGQVLTFGVKLTGAPTPKHRVSWRLLNRD